MPSHPLFQSVILLVTDDGDANFHSMANESITIVETVLFKLLVVRFFCIKTFPLNDVSPPTDNLILRDTSPPTHK